MKPASLQRRLAIAVGLLVTVLWIAAASFTAYRQRLQMDMMFDASLRETAHRYLDDPAESARIVGNATEAYAEALAALPARFESVMEEILSCATR